MEENDCRNYIMINLYESMGPGWDQTRDPWICSQIRICSQTRYQLRYGAQMILSWLKVKTVILFLFDLILYVH